jgi:hypothetical protein
MWLQSHFLHLIQAFRLLKKYGGKSYFDPFSLGYIPHPIDVIEAVSKRYQPDGMIEFVGEEGNVKTKRAAEPIDINLFSKEEITNLRDEIAQALFDYCRGASRSHDEIESAHRESVLAHHLAAFQSEAQLLREAAQVTTEAIRVGLPFIRLQMGERVWKYQLDRVINYESYSFTENFLGAN